MKIELPGLTGRLGRHVARFLPAGPGVFALSRATGVDMITRGA